MKKYLLLFILISIGSQVFGQGQISLYQMQKSIPQANFVNPAFRSTSKFIIGLPAISSTYVSLETPIAIRDVLKRNTDNTLRIDTDAFLDALRNNNRISFRANTSLLFLGLNTKKSFITFSINTRFNGAFAFPASVFESLISETDVGSDGSKNIVLDDFDLRASLYNELGIGYNRNVTEKLIVGVKLKYLQGIANVDLQDLNGSITTNIDSVHITTGNWSVQSSGINYLSDDPDPSYFYKNKNVGWAVDLGAQYMVNDNLRVSASILDLGGISWKEDTESRVFESSSFTFDGFDFLEIVNGDSTDDIFQRELDELDSIFQPKEVVDESYRTSLTGRFYLGGTYTLMDMHTFGTVFYGEVFKSRFTPAIALTYNIALGKILDVGVSAGYRNKTLGNFGAGLSAKLGPVQLYLLGANVESLFYPSRARSVGIRGGLVLSLGKVSQFE